jgi:uncharacterized protein YlxW (UPF0749 family)
MRLGSLRLALPERLGVAVVAALVGFLLVGQLRGQVRYTQRLQAESEGDLARILASLTAEADALRDERATLELELATLETSSARDEAAVAAARAQIDALEVLAGVVPAHGPGIVLTVTDSRGAVGYDTFVDIVQELRDAGAEAIAINDVRVGATTAFGEQDGRILVGTVAVTAPYRVVAIGRPETLESGLAIPGGALDTLRTTPGVTATVVRVPDVTVPALASPPAFRVARPVASSG